MKTLLIIFFVGFCVTLSAQPRDGVIDGAPFVVNAYPVDTITIHNDTIPGWALITEGPQAPAKQVFAYEVRYGYVVRRYDCYLDAYKLPFNRDVIVWDFRPRESRRGR